MLQNQIRIEFYRYQTCFSIMMGHDKRWCNIGLIDYMSKSNIDWNKGRSYQIFELLILRLCNKIKSCINLFDKTIL